MENKNIDAIVARFPNLKDFYPFIEELNKENPRGRVLISAGFLEEQLKRILLAFMLENSHADELVTGHNAPIGTFSARTKACYALGLITEDEHHNLTLVRKIRNDFAHEVHVSFATESVSDRCRALRFETTNLTPKAPATGFDPEERFVITATTLILALTNRAEHVAKERRAPKSWSF